MSQILLRGDARFTCLWQVYPPQADEPYMQSLSRSGLLEPRIETTLQVRLNPYLLGLRLLPFRRTHAMKA